MRSDAGETERLPKSGPGATVVRPVKGKIKFPAMVWPEVWMANAIQPGTKSESGFPCVLRGAISWQMAAVWPK